MKPPTAYTADQVDSLYARFEKCAQRQNANKSSAVKLRAAEGDLLRVTEEVRDLLNKAVKGDRQLLVDVFGGNCMRFHRFRKVKETVELSPMHAKDPRWQHLSDSMDTIEEILKQLGTFKPFAAAGKVAPEIYSYKGHRERFTPGERVWMRPECEGSEADSFQISTGLPEGLSFNPTSGEISGTLKPGAEVPNATYIVTATNAHGETKIELNFTVGQPPPKSVVYAEAPSACYTNEFVHWAPEIDGGKPKEWSVSPPLPPGLSLDPCTGTISGMPTDDAEPKDYTITAKNACGVASTVLSFRVKPAPPISLKYPDAKNEYTSGSVIYLRPEVALQTSVSGSRARPMSANWDLLRAKFLTSNAKWQNIIAAVKARIPKLTFTVEPALPDGLSLAAKTGVISGQPGSPSEAATYTITCRNDGGQTSAELRFGVRPQAPSSLTYPKAGEAYYLGQPVTLSPQLQGLASEWQVVPALPPGLHLDASLGIISGVPTEVVPEGSWTVTARNTHGETSAALTFAVRRAAPSGLEYPALAEAYPVLRVLALQPTVEGQVDGFTVEPALPSGLELNHATGVIEGAPSATTQRATYTVTARNETGTATASLTFEVKVMPPELLAYPQVDDVYNVGETLCLEPQVEGGATSWTLEPPLPTGLALDAATGKISGAPTSLADEVSYVVTASNEAGGTSAVLTFQVTAPKPEGLCYPNASGEYTVGEPLTLEPQLDSCICATFTVEPALPEGLQLDPATGVISGAPSTESVPTAYTVVAANPTGSCSVELTFSCTKAAEEDAATGVNLKFAAAIEEITDIADLCEEPGQGHNLGDWMIWMVHRAWLNDPSLTDFNFANKWMPPPHLEPRIAPKLMKALAHNTKIVCLQLANSNLMKPQGHDLAEALKKNTSLRILNVETNSLDSDGLAHIAAALKENNNSALEQFRFNNQKTVGDYFGRPVEQAFAELVEHNQRIVKLGFSCNDAHWRLKIDRAILRNNDLARRRRKGSTCEEQKGEVAAQDKPLARLLLTTPPEKAVWEVFDFEDERSTLARAFMADNKRLPTKEQLQSFARSRGKPIPYSAVATVVKDFRGRLVGAAVNSQVTVCDTYGAEFPGCLRAWSEKNERWNLDVWKGGDTRYNFASDKQPIIEVSAEFATWLHPPE
mmetsp:Transcript_148349/g.413260  ORF Transcript_148349/g.413260 Transcript_148349/m.413260 type:complete len:1150 (+) Transcript_148349:72-3521(+)